MPIDPRQPVPIASIVRGDSAQASSTSPSKRQGSVALNVFTAAELSAALVAVGIRDDDVAVYQARLRDVITSSRRNRRRMLGRGALLVSGVLATLLLGLGLVYLQTAFDAAIQVAPPHYLYVDGELGTGELTHWVFSDPYMRAGVFRFSSCLASSLILVAVGLYAHAAYSRPDPIENLQRAAFLVERGKDLELRRCLSVLERQYLWPTGGSRFRTLAARGWQAAGRSEAARQIGLLEAEIDRNDFVDRARLMLATVLVRSALDLWSTDRSLRPRSQLASIAHRGSLAARVAAFLAFAASVLPLGQAVWQLVQTLKS